MASRVKVNINTADLISALEKRIEELESVSDEVTRELSTQEQEFLNALDRVREGTLNGNLVREMSAHYNGHSKRSSLWHALSERSDRLFYASPELVKALSEHPDRTREETISAIQKQIKLLSLSSDETVTVGINDELYELL